MHGLYLHKALAYPDQDDAAVMAASGGWNQHVEGGRGHNGEAKHSLTCNTQTHTHTHEKKLPQAKVLTFPTARGWLDVQHVGIVGMYLEYFV